MKWSLLLLACLPLAHAGPVLIGTRTGGDSKGIYVADFNAETGALSGTRLVAEVDNPGFLALHPTLPLVYSTGKDALHVFRYADDAGLEPLGSVPCGGKGPCHLEVAGDGSILAAANYGDGTVSWIKLDAEGKFSGDVGLIRHEGKSVHPDRQQGPHAHGTHFIGKLLVVPDLGLDQLVLYDLHPDKGLVAHDPPFVATKPGDGPRHVAFAPDGRSAFAIHELSNVAEAFRLDGGKLVSTDREPTLPDEWDGRNTTAEIEVHPNGKWVIGSNRGHDSLAVFAFDPESGALARKAIVPCVVKTPRHFKLSPDGRWLLAAGQDSGNIATFRFDPASGDLQPTGQLLEAPSPICLVFLPERPR